MDKQRQQAPPGRPPAPANLLIKGGVALLSRLVLNTGRRFIYPFAPAISRGAGLQLTDVTGIIAVNQLSGLLAFVLGPLVDRIGYRPMMTAGLALLVTGMAAAAVFPGYGVLMAAMVLAGLGKSIFDPALQAYVGERVPFAQRARVIGLLETAWAGSSLVGIPLMGVLIDGFGWKAPFWALALVGGGAMAGLWAVLDPSEPKPGPSTFWPDMCQAWQRILRRRPCLGLMGVAFCTSGANDNLFVIYGAWLEGAFKLTVVGLGVGAGLIGMAELAGEMLTALLADRCGLKKALAGGLVLTAISYALLPFFPGTLAAALAGLAAVFLFFEFSIVTALSLATEVLPGNRAAMMAAVMAAAGLGRSVGAMAGGLIWQKAGIGGVGLVSAAMTLMGLLCLLIGLRSWSARTGSDLP